MRIVVLGIDLGLAGLDETGAVVLRGTHKNEDTKLYLFCGLGYCED
jgi:hypothetical protein